MDQHLGHTMRNRIELQSAEMTDHAASIGSIEYLVAYAEGVMTEDESR